MSQEHKDKARELVEKFSTKEDALRCIDEIIKTCPQKENEIFGISKGIKFWQEVKKEMVTIFYF